MIHSQSNFYDVFAPVAFRRGLLEARAELMLLLTTIARMLRSAVFIVVMMRRFGGSENLLRCKRLIALSRYSRR